MTQAEKRLEWLCSFTIIKYRFIHEILMLMSKHPDTKMPTMGVKVEGTGFDLAYNPDFFMQLTDPEAMFVFSHECFHLVMHHCTRRKFDNHVLGNIAQDLAVNELIEEQPGSCEKPKAFIKNEKSKKIEEKLFGCFVEDLEKDPLFNGILRKQAAEWYYDFLNTRLPKMTIKIKRKGQGDGKGEKDKGSGKGDQDKDKSQTGSGSQEITIEVCDEHGGWDKNNEIADEIIRAKVEEMMRGNKWGDLSAGTIETIMAAQKSEVNWRRFIRAWAGNMVWREREVTVKRPNRRTGFKHPGFKKTHIDKILLAIDTSGSIGSEDLAQFLREMNRIQELTPVDVMQFDADKTTEPKAYDKKRDKFDFKGRGGSNFQPVMDTAKNHRYKGLVILTDGQADAPTKPPATKVLWALTKPGMNPPVTWGQKVWLKRH